MIQNRTTNKMIPIGKFSIVCLALAALSMSNLFAQMDGVLLHFWYKMGLNATGASIIFISLCVFFSFFFWLKLLIRESRRNTTRMTVFDLHTTAARGFFLSHLYGFVCKDKRCTIFVYFVDEYKIVLLLWNSYKPPPRKMKWYLCVS